jgi:hypothetical protein
MLLLLLLMLLLLLLLLLVGMIHRVLVRAKYGWRAKELVEGEYRRVGHDK